jgi:hypothetical protein
MVSVDFSDPPTAPIQDANAARVVDKIPSARSGAGFRPTLVIIERQTVEQLFRGLLSPAPCCRRLVELGLKARGK